MKNLSVGDVAKELNLDYFRVIRMIKRNEFPHAFKVGWGWVIPNTDMRKFRNSSWKKSIKKLLRRK